MYPGSSSSAAADSSSPVVGVAASQATGSGLQGAAVGSSGQGGAIPGVPASGGRPGKVGEVPEGAGVVYFPEAGGYKYFEQTLYGVAGLFVLLGVVMMIGVGGPSWLFMAMAVPFVLWGLNRRKRQRHVDCVADEGGLTVRRSTGRTPDPAVYLPWAAVQKTHCASFTSTTVSTDSDSDTKKEYMSFQVAAPGYGTVVLEETRVKNLAGLISMANERTPQLEYVWVPAAEANGRKVMARTGKYWMVGRG